MLAHHRNDCGQVGIVKGANGESKGFGFVVFRDVAGAQAALAPPNVHVIGQRRLKVQLAVEGRKPPGEAKHDVSRLPRAQADRPSRRVGSSGSTTSRAAQPLWSESSSSTQAPQTSDDVSPSSSSAHSSASAVARPRLLSANQQLDLRFSAPLVQQAPMLPLQFAGYTMPDGTAPGLAYQQPMMYFSMPQYQMYPTSSYFSPPLMSPPFHMAQFPLMHDPRLLGHAWGSAPIGLPLAFPSIGAAQAGLPAFIDPATMVPINTPARSAAVALMQPSLSAARTASAPAVSLTRGADQLATSAAAARGLQSKAADQEGES